MHPAGPTGFYFHIFVKVLIQRKNFFKSSGKKSQILEYKKEILSASWKTVLVRDAVKCEQRLKL